MLCEHVCTQVVLSAGRLPLKSPHQTSTSSKLSSIRRSTLKQNAKPSLCCAVPNIRNAVANDPSAQGSSVGVPVFSRQGSEMPKRKSASMRFCQRNKPQFRNCHHCPGNACGGQKTMDAPQQGSRSGCREVTPRINPTIKENLKQIQRCPIKRNEAAWCCDLAISWNVSGSDQLGLMTTALFTSPGMPRTAGIGSTSGPGRRPSL